MQALLTNVDATAVATGLVPVLCDWCAGHFPCLQHLLQPTSAQVGGYLSRSRLLPLKHMLHSLNVSNGSNGSACYCELHVQ
jgi:hypothetical protein